MSAYTDSNAAIELVLEVGIANIERHILDLTTRLITGLEAKGYRTITPKMEAARAGIVIFESVKQTPAETYEVLLEQHIITAERGSGVRVSPHFYNTEAEIVRLLDALPAL